MSIEKKAGRKPVSFCLVQNSNDWKFTLSSYCRNTNLHTSVTWFRYSESLRYFRCKRSADTSNIQWREITFRKKSFKISFKPNPINLKWYDCVISSRGSIIFTRRTGERFWGVVEGGTGGVRLKCKFLTMSCLYSRYMYKCINITI